jgi:hypothetical protein
MEPSYHGALTSKADRNDSVAAHHQSVSLQVKEVTSRILLPAGVDRDVREKYDIGAVLYDQRTAIR